MGREPTVLVASVMTVMSVSTYDLKRTTCTSISLLLLRVFLIQVDVMGIEHESRVPEECHHARKICEGEISTQRNRHG